MFIGEILFICENKLIKQFKARLATQFIIILETMKTLNDFKIKQNEEREDEEEGKTLNFDSSFSKEKDVNILPCIRWSCKIYQNNL